MRHRHIFKWKSLYEGIIFDQYGYEVHEYLYCDVCKETPTSLISKDKYGPDIQ